MSPPPKKDDFNYTGDITMFECLYISCFLKYSHIIYIVGQIKFFSVNSF